MKNESVKKLLLRSQKNVLEENARWSVEKFTKKTNMFTIIAMNFVQEQLYITD